MRSERWLHQRRSVARQHPGAARGASREVSRKGWPPRELQRQERGEGAPGEVSHRQVWQPPDEPHPQTACGRDVAVRGAQKVVQHDSKFQFRKIK